MLFDILVLVSFLCVLLLLRPLVDILPSLLACLMRGKESLNLEASVKLSRDRDALALVMMLPFCLTAFRYRLYAPGVIDAMDDNAVLGLYLAVFAVYLLLRVVVIWLFRPHKMSPKTYAAADKSAFSFFIIYTLVLLAVGVSLPLFGVSDGDVRSAMLWISALIYVLYLIRKTQIFSSSCSIFAAFLYLCALELLPTGILVVSAIIF